ncbi:MAG: AAA family ATPase [Kofleriaceae bacterium]|nr:AAA family ATPase [Kofleriaceae bacterium]
MASSSLPRIQDMPLPGLTLRERLGAGSMGIVFRAYDEQRGVDVALKWLPRADGVALSRFKQEFRALADLLHPNLLPLYELHCVAGTWFFTMPLIDATSFLGWVRPGGDDEVDAPGGDATGTSDGWVATTVTSSDPRAHVAPPRPAGRTLDVARLRQAVPQLIEGVAALHRAGKLHRDLKPANVLIDPHGHLYVSDFGLVFDPADGGLDRELVVGTPAYMSPEQAEGLPLDEASDWYAVGTMLFEALTGERPFLGDVAELREQRRLFAAPAVRELAPELPAELDDLIELVDALLQRDPRDRPTGATLRDRLGAPAAAAAPTTPEAGDAPFVGRRAELAALHRALADRRDGTVAVLLDGASGMGKSALLHAFLDQAAAAGALVVAGRCYQRESVPYKALDGVVDALTAHLRDLAPAQLPALPAPARAALCRLFPVLRQVPWPTATARAGTDDDATPQRILRRATTGFRQLVADLAARRPLIIAVDDLQWGDVDSVGFFLELLQLPAHAGVLLIACHRREDADATPLRGPLRAAAAELARPDVVRAVALEPLAPAEVATLVRRLAVVELGDDQLAALIREAGGSPLFAGELARVGAAVLGGARLDELIAARVATLPAPARALLTAIAVAGTSIDLETASRAAAVADPTAATALDVARLIRGRAADGGRIVECYHDRIREAVTARLDAGARVDVHRALADALEATGAADPQALVAHRLGAGDRAAAAGHARVAAAQARDALAFHRAADYYRLARELGDVDAAEARRLRALEADMLANAGSLAAAGRAYLDAAHDAAGDDAIVRRARAVEATLQAGHLEAALAMARPLRRGLGLRLPPTGWRALAEVVARRVWLRGRGMRYTPRRADQLPPRALLRHDLSWTLASAMAMYDPIVGRAMQLRCAQDALRLGEPVRVARARMLLAAARSSDGAHTWPEIKATLGELEPLIAVAGTGYLRGLLHTTHAVAANTVARWDLGVEHAARAEQLLDGVPEGAWAAAISRSFHANALAMLGRLRDLGAYLQQELHDAEWRGDRVSPWMLRTQRGNVHWLAIDQPAEARRQYALDPEPAAGRSELPLAHHYKVLGVTASHLYEDDAAAAWRSVDASWRRMSRSLMVHIQVFVIDMQTLRARAALAAAATGAGRDAGAGAGDRRRGDRRADPRPRAAGRRLERRCARSLAQLDGERAGAATWLQTAAAGFAARSGSSCRRAPRGCTPACCAPTAPATPCATPRSPRCAPRTCAGRSGSPRCSRR